MPKRLRYAKETEAATIRVNEIKNQWCKDGEEWAYTKGVQYVLKKMKWSKNEDEAGGITRIELYAIYTIHG